MPDGCCGNGCAVCVLDDYFDEFAAWNEKKWAWKKHQEKVKAAEKDGSGGKEQGEGPGSPGAAVSDDRATATGNAAQGSVDAVPPSKTPGALLTRDEVLAFAFEFARRGTT